MSQEIEALELLERAGDELTDIIMGMGESNVRSRLLGIAEEIDDFLFDAEEPLDADMVVDEYDVDEYDDDEDDTFEDDEELA